MFHDSTQLDLMFQALADPARRGMVERLAQGPASVSELAQPFSMSLSAVMQHLQVLEASGLVRSQKSGRVRTCHMESPALGTAERWISDRRATWEHRLDRLGDFLSAVQKDIENDLCSEAQGDTFDIRARAALSVGA